MFTTSMLYKKFDYFNTTYFNNELPSITLKAPNRKVKRRYGTFSFRFNLKTKQVKPQILVYQLTSNKGENGWENTLLHEMIHYHLFLKYGQKPLQDYMNNPNDISRRGYNSVSRKFGHTSEFYSLLTKFWNLETNNTTSPEKQKIRSKQETPKQTPTTFSIGQEIKTNFGLGKIARILKSNNSYILYATLPNGNQAKVVTA